MLTSPGQVYLKALQVVGSHKEMQRPWPLCPPSTVVTQVSKALTSVPPSIQAVPSLSLHRVLIHIDNTPRCNPDRFSPPKAPLFYMFLILPELGWLISAASMHVARSDASTYTLLCLQARTSFVWISSKPLYSLPLNLKPSHYESIPIYCHCSLNNQWDSEEI